MANHITNQSGLQIIADDELHNVLLAFGITVPADGASGYATGCIFIHTDGGTATATYQNEGTSASADFNPLSSGGGIDLNGLTATAAEINASSDVSGRLVSIADDTTYTVLAANSGRPHVLPDLTSSITIDLPAAASGLEYHFISKAVAADGQDWIFDTGAAANFYLGGLAFLDTDAGAGADELSLVAPNGSSNDIMTIKVPQPGTRLMMICDGTNWIVSGTIFAATAPTFSDT